MLRTHCQKPVCHVFSLHVALHCFVHLWKVCLILLLVAVQISFRRGVQKQSAKFQLVLCIFSFFDARVYLCNWQTLIHHFWLLSANAEIRAIAFLLNLFLLILNNVSNLLFCLNTFHLKLVYFFSQILYLCNCFLICWNLVVLRLAST